MRLLVVLIGVCLFGAESAYAQKNRSWNRIDVPDAYCGLGEDYRIFVSPGTSTRVAIAFQGGGACWSEDSCFGWIKTTDLSAPAKIDEKGGIWSTSKNESPIHDATIFYLPYCTGDVYAGRHITQYGKNTVYHVGAENVEKSLTLIKSLYGVELNAATEMTVYGYSAGAIGAIVHARLIEDEFDFIVDKKMIADAPGLHWGSKFWHKFTPELITDYSAFVQAGGFPFDINNGLIAGVVTNLCSYLVNWNIGIIQSTRDRVMSFVFGSISAGDHAANVLGPNGIYELTKDPTDNCSAWVPDSGSHTFLPESKSSPPVIAGVGPMDYARKVISGQAVPSYK